MKCALIVLLALCAVSGVNAGIVTGNVTDLETGETVAAATVRVEGTGRSMLANDDGAFRIRLDPGMYRLKISHVAYYSEYLEVTVGDSAVSLSFALRPNVIVLPGIKVYERDYDPGQRIIVEAIRRKIDILSQLHSYQFSAYARFVVNDESVEDSAEVALLVESQLECYWEYPDKYKETIVARRQSSNIEAEGNLVAIGEILNFNKNRIDIDQYSVVSPTAEDALDHYNYYLMDSLLIDDQLVFRLEIEPQNQNKPLFKGTIDIADSSFAVVGVDVGFSPGVDIQYLSEVRYGQRFAEFEGGRWMPIEIRFSGDVDLPIPGLPPLSFDYVAALHEYTFETAIPEGTFDYVLEVHPDADDIDSTVWNAGQLIPLSAYEQRGYERIDSLENVSTPILKKLALAPLTLMMIAASPQYYDFFHFNRVEGAYLGLAARLRNLLPNTSLDVMGGYAFENEYPQRRLGLTHRLFEDSRFDLSLEHHSVLARRLSIMPTESYNPTFLALLARIDPFDYYREKGYSLGASVDLSKRLRVDARYNDVRHSSDCRNTNWGVFGGDTAATNPAIRDGKMRYLSAGLNYDSRPPMKLKGELARMGGVSYTTLSVRLEKASPDLIDNDFHFLRYSASLHRSQRTLGLGVTDIFAFAGASKRDLPPQKYFKVVGDDVIPMPLSLKTLGDGEFYGNRAAQIYGMHDFGRALFMRSGIPMVKDIPLSLSVHGGVCWAEFEDHTAQPGDDIIASVARPYSELGFGLGRILGLPLKLYFTWQLSKYDTNAFSITWGFDF